MTVDDVAKMVADLRACDDFEVQHASEDGIHVAVLQAIAKQIPDTWAGQLATEALKTLDIEFGRYCA